MFIKPVNYVVGFLQYLYLYEKKNHETEEN